ncbi:MAG: phosphotransferase [bacterium]
MRKDIDKVYLIETIRQKLGIQIEDIDILKLKGDASDREYFRLKLYSNFNNTPSNISSLILMKLNGNNFEANPSFIEILFYLKRCELNIPSLYYYDQKPGFIFLQDLGDLTLEKKVKGRGSKFYYTFYKQAINDLLKLQIRGTRDLNPDCVASHLFFDVEKFMWELLFFMEHYVERLKNIKLNSVNRHAVEKLFLEISQTLDNEPKYLTHRDYHSRNLMVFNDQLWMIDFQDARMGLCQYDLASLLRDSYVVLEEKLVDDLIEYYITKKEELEGKGIDRAYFRRIFDYISIQRNLKAVGTFAYQVVVKKNDRYLQYIPSTLNYVKKNLDKYNELRGLRELSWLN